MAESSIEHATRRLSAALDGLDAALDRRRDADQRAASLSDQLARLSADRARLAAELDRQLSRANTLDAAGRDVSHRLDRAIEAVKSVVDRQEA